MVDRTGWSAEPFEIEVLAQQQGLRIAWEDGHESHYPLIYLRGYCPCAVCQHHAAAWRFVSNTGPAIREFKEVGSYALNIVFADEHRTGIYSFERLRELCPCEVCQCQQGDAHPLRRLPADVRVHGVESTH